MKSTRKTLILFSSLAIVASLSVVGSGFAVWTFEDGVNEANIEVNEVSISDAFNLHVHAPNIFVLEPDMNNISTYGGLAFYNEKLSNEEGSGSSSSAHQYDHFFDLDNDDEKIFASVIVGVLPSNTSLTALPFDVVMSIKMEGFIKDNINFIGEDIKDNEGNYLYTFESSSFNSLEIENNDGTITKYFRSDNLCLDGLFVFNESFNQNYKNEEGIINIQAINNAIPNNGSLGTITLSFNIVEKTN